MQLVGISMEEHDAANFKEALREEEMTGPLGVGDLGPPVEVGF
jgi:hypothetical protein